MRSKTWIESEDRWFSCYNLLFLLERLKIEGADILNVDDEAFSIYSFIERLYDR